MDDITREQTAILEVERSWWQAGTTKDAVIRERLGVEPIRYYLALNHLIDDPAAMAHDPLLVRRLRRIRETQQAKRQARRYAGA